MFTQLMALAGSSGSHTFYTGRSERRNTLSILSATELTTTVISLPSEDEPLFFNNLISSRLVESGDIPRGRGGRGGSFLVSGKICDPSDRLFIAVFDFFDVWIKFPPFVH